jgi:hypothetical protein
MSTLSEVNHQLESRMRETRLSGSEGGGAKSIASPYLYQGVDSSQKLGRPVADFRLPDKTSEDINCQ